MKDRGARITFLSLLANAGRICVWWLIAEYMIHLMYMHTIQANETYLEILPPWALGKCFCVRVCAYMCLCVRACSMYMHVCFCVVQNCHTLYLAKETASNLSSMIKPSVQLPESKTFGTLHCISHGKHFA